MRQTLVFIKLFIFSLCDVPRDSFCDIFKLMFVINEDVNERIVGKGGN